MQENTKGTAQDPRTEGATPDNIHPAIRQIGEMPAMRQIGIMVALAMSVAIGVAVVLWSRTPDYSLLYASVADKDVGEVLAALDSLNVDYRVESSSGAILVPRENVHDVRLELAAHGLPKSENPGFELLRKWTEFGTSKSLEAASFQHALENEIARTITSIQNVKSVRVHLALPKQSVFVGQSKKPGASILINLYAGRNLEKNQLQAIVHLVASSVPQLEPGQVTVVDQHGRLLNRPDHSDEISVSSRHFEYKKQVEEHLIERAENILIPLVGENGIRIQATADIDFTSTESTREQFNPDLPALRSEQVQEESNQYKGSKDFPSATDRHPSAAGIASKNPDTGRPTHANESGRNSTKSATRNYELDKTVSHTRHTPGMLRRLSVAVIIDDRTVLQGDGSIVKKPYSEEEVMRFTELVKQAVGFDVARGDRVTVTNSTFREQLPPEPIPDAPLWEQSWFTSLLRQLTAAAIVAFLIFGILRPAVRNLTGRHESAMNGGPGMKALAASANGAENVGMKLAGGQQTLSGVEDPVLIEAPQSYEKRLEFAKKLVDDDPKRVAQVLKNWLSRND